MFNISERHNNPKSHHPPHLLIILFILLFPLVAKKQVVIYIYTKSIRRKLTVSFLSKVSHVSPKISCDFYRFRCVLPFEYENATYKLDDDIVNVSLPWNNFAQERESCEYYDANYTKEYFREGIPANKTKHCDKWIFYHPEFKSSTVIEVKKFFFNINN